MPFKTEQRKGFTFVEAVLSISLVAAAQLYTTAFQAEMKQFDKAQLFASDLADVVHAIDKRVFLDGYLDQVIDPTTGAVTKGDWSKSWIDAKEVFSDMLNQELIASGNSICGDTVNGWVPKNTDNSAIALVKCNKISSENVPFGFSASALRENNGIGYEHYLKSWSILLYHDTDEKFSENYKFYPTIKKNIEFYDNLRMTGLHKVSFVDRSDPSYPKLSDASKCSTIKSLCGILIEFTPSVISEDSETPFLPIDGSGSMVGDITFKTTAGTAVECYDHDGNTVSCGFDFDTASGNLALYSDDITAQDYRLMYNNGVTPIITYCDEGSISPDSKPCGMSMVYESGSYLAEAHWDKLWASDIFFSNLETDGTITIRETLDPSAPNYEDKLVFSKNGLKYDDLTDGHNEVTFDTTGTKIESTSKNINMKAAEVGIEAPILSFGQDTTVSSIGSKLTLEGENIYRKTTTDQSSTSSAYFDTKNSKIATRAMVYDGVKVMAINRVNSGTPVPRSVCPVGDTGTAPPIQVLSYPSDGFYTQRQDIYAGSRCRTNTSEFMTASIWWSWLNNTSPIKGTLHQNITVRCDPSRDSAVAYSTDPSGSNWIPRAYFWGGSRRAEVSIPMTVMQYCDYK